MSNESNLSISAGGSWFDARVEVCGGERSPRTEALPERVDLLDRRWRVESPDPLGRVPVDRDTLTAIADLPFVSTMDAAHAPEHAIEVELPFLVRLAPQARGVGIAVGQGDLAACRRFAGGLAEVLRRRPDKPLLLISSDMNHFAADAENRRLDELALAALETLDKERGTQQSRVDVGHEEAAVQPVGAPHTPGMQPAVISGLLSHVST